MTVTAVVTIIEAIIILAATAALLCALTFFTPIDTTSKK
jgi:hypothetical protein